MYIPRSTADWKFAVVLIASGLIGLAMGVKGIDKLRRGGVDVAPLTGFEYWIIIVSFCTGAAVFLFNVDRMGRPGWKGCATCIYGVCRMVFFGALIGGTIMLPVHGTIYAPVIIMSVALETPMDLLIWFVEICVCHKLIMDWRNEKRAEAVQIMASEKITGGLAPSP